MNLAAWWRRLPPWPLGLAAAFIGLTVAYPVTLLFLQSIFPDIIGGKFHGFLEAYGRIAQTQGLVEMLLNSLAWAGCTTMGAWCLGIPCGFLLARTDLRAKGLARVLILIPVMTPAYLTALAYVLLLQPGGFADSWAGGVPAWLRATFFGFWGVTFLMTIMLFGGVALVVEAALRSLSTRLEDAARCLGCSRWETFRRITFPLLLPALLNVGLIVFLESISNFGVPAIMGPRSNLPLLPAEIYFLVTSWPVDLPLAAALSGLLALMAVGLLAASRWFLNRYPIGRTRTPVVHVLQLPRWGHAAAWAFLLILTALSAGIPLGVTVLTSLVDRWGGGSPALTLRHYAEVFASHSRGWQAIQTSFALSLLTACITTVIGGLSAYALARHRGWLATTVDNLSLLPRILPNIVVAVAMIMAWNAPWVTVDIYNTVWLLLVAYLALYQAEAFRYGEAGMRQIGFNLEQAAASLGASRWQTLRYVVVPLLLPNLGVAWVLTFIVCIRDWVASVILLPPGMETTGSYIYNQFDQGEISKAMVMATATIVLSTFVLLLLQWRRRSS